MGVVFRKQGEKGNDRSVMWLIFLGIRVSISAWGGYVFRRVIFFPLSFSRRCLDNADDKSRAL